jgi:hypothetical protein
MVFLDARSLFDDAVTCAGDAGGEETFPFSI